MVDKKTNIPPHSKESEMMVLGCMLTSINSLNVGADSLDDSDFYFTEHKLVFQALKAAYMQEKPADVHLVCEELKRQEKLKAVGGAAYVTTLAQYAGTSAYTESYIELVKSKSVLRRMIDAAQTVERTAKGEPDDVSLALDEAQGLFFKISQAANPAAGRTVEEILTGVRAKSETPFLKELEERQESFKEKGPDDPGITGIPTRFTDLDKMINGLNDSHLLIVAGRPAMGKTAFAINIAEHVCFDNDVPVGIFSLEMTAEQLVHRIVCSQSEVESDKILTGSLNGIEYQRVVASVNRMQKHTMVIDDQPGLRITDLRARARRMKEVHNIGLLVVDYLQLLTGSGGRSQESRQAEISEISRMLKNLSRELDIPVICLSQLSRKVEERQGHRPMMSDLRESGCLTGDTLITNARTGEQVTIKELAERPDQTPFPVHAVDRNWKVGVHNMSKAFYSGRKTIYELRTRTGRTIKASANHPFLKLQGWKRLDQLRAGDRVALPRAMKCDQIESNLKDDEYILLAHLLGDGCILKGQPYHYTSQDEANLQVVTDAADRLFGIQARRVKQKNWHHVYLRSPYRLTHGVYHPITNWYRELGIDRVRSYNKRVPSAVISSSNEKIALFLHHLWATDGNVSWKLLPGRKPSAAIYYATTSPVLARQVQHLLLRLGISCKDRIIPQKNSTRPIHHVHIECKDNKLKFLRQVGCFGNRGKIIPELVAALDEIDTLAHADVIPKEAWLLFVTPEKERAQISWRQFAKNIGMSFCGSTLFKSAISRKRMGAVCEALGSPQLLVNLAQSDILWDTIDSITELGEEDVYDATVDDVHNFVANDIIVHNSIEQDSDIIMFLLRREYYDPMDKPGMAEVIVGKNRHGAVGTVNLTFRKEFAQFTNYSPMNYNDSPDMSGAFAEFS